MGLDCFPRNGRFPPTSSKTASFSSPSSKEITNHARKRIYLWLIIFGERQVTFIVKTYHSCANEVLVRIFDWKASYMLQMRVKSKMKRRKGAKYCAERVTRAFHHHFYTGAEMMAQILSSHRQWLLTPHPLGSFLYILIICDHVLVSFVFVSSFHLLFSPCIAATWVAFVFAFVRKLVIEVIFETIWVANAF